MSTFIIRHDTVNVAVRPLDSWRRLGMRIGSVVSKLRFWLRLRRNPRKSKARETMPLDPRSRWSDSLQSIPDAGVPCSQTIHQRAHSTFGMTYRDVEMGAASMH